MGEDVLTGAAIALVSCGGLLAAFFVAARWWLLESLKAQKRQEEEFNRMAVDFADRLGKAFGKALRDEGRRIVDYLMKETEKGAGE